MRTCEDNHQLGSGCLAEHPHLLEMYARFIHGSRKKLIKKSNKGVRVNARQMGISQQGEK